MSETPFVMAKKSAKKNNNNKVVNQLNHIQATVATVLSVTALLCFLYLALVERPANNSSRLTVLGDEVAISQAALVSSGIAQLQKRIQSFSLSPQLATALMKGDADAIQLFRQQLQVTFPEAVSSQLIELGPLGIASLDTDAVPLRNNIELDLLRRASNGETVSPEAYKVGQQWLFTLAKDVKPEGARYARAALMLTFDGGYIKELLAGVKLPMGETRLVQQFGNNQAVIAAMGQSAENYVARAETTVANWRIEFKPNNQFLERSTVSAISLWAVLALLIIVAAAMAVYAIAQMKKQLQLNLQKLRSGNGQADFSLPEFDQFSGTLTAVEESPEEELAEDAEPELKPIPEPAQPKEEKAPEPASSVLDDLPADLPATIFRAYDIRGIADSELTDEIAHAIAMAIGSESVDQGQQKVVVAMDGRESSPRIKEAVIKGLMDSGRDVLDIGMVPTPLMYFATHHLGTHTGVMITGSHNPGKYNGIKIVIGGRALAGPAIEALRERVLSKNLSEGAGSCQTADVVEAYVDYIVNDIAIAQPLKVVLDAGNGVAGVIAPRLFEELGCEVIPLYCEVDGSFPNHHPDPTVEENLADMKAAIAEHGADLGIAFDGDGDRLGVVTATGQSVPADRLLMLMAQDVVSRNPGADVLFDVKCTRNLNALISNYGGRPVMWKTGHSFMKEKMAETGALLGGEFSGHIFFKERWFGFDDGLYSGARLIEILSTTDPDLDAQLQAFPESIGSPELKVASDDEHKFTIMDQLATLGQFGEGKITTLDGVRVDFSDGWGLVRASNTTPMLILRFEADTEDAMARIQALFKEQLLSVDNSLQFGF